MNKQTALFYIAQVWKQRRYQDGELAILSYLDNVILPSTTKHVRINLSSLTIR